MHEDQAALGRAAARTGDSEHSRGNVGVASCLCDGHGTPDGNGNRHDMDATLQAEKRDGRGKNEARRLRASGRIPAVVYGAEKDEAVEIAVDPKALLRILHSESGVNTLIGLQLDGGDTRVLVKEYQLDPDRCTSCCTPTSTRSRWTGAHASRCRSCSRARRRASSSRAASSTSFTARSRSKCLPGDIPENITVDVSELMMHEGIRVRDLAWRARSGRPSASPTR